MTKKLSSEQFQYYTHDLGCATALISVGCVLISFDRENPRKVGFVFRGDAKLSRAVEEYFSDKLIVNPRAFFDNLRMLKNRIYGS